MTRPSDDELSGMTANERLIVLGILGEFDAAARKRDRTAMIELLSQCAISIQQAERIADTILAHPATYGF